MGLLSVARGRNVVPLEAGGLLSRIEKKITSKQEDTAAAALDQMGKAIRERLQKLPHKNTTPYTALSLLKAYGAFQAGICLSLKGDTYSSYTTVGLGVEKISIPMETIWSEERFQDKYFELVPHEKLEIKEAEKDSVYWVFPLCSPANKAAQPWKAAMILGATQTSGFDPKVISDVLEGMTEKLILPKDYSEMAADCGFADVKSVKEPEGSGNSVEEDIIMFHRIYLDFHCILLENPYIDGNAGKNSEETAEFLKKVSEMIDKMGTVIPLHSGRPLILLPIVLDRNLIAHRLSGALNTKALLSFEANNTENVFTRLDFLI